MVKKFLYFLFWIYKVRILKKKIPLQPVLFINNICNLKCKHCDVIENEKYSKTYDEIERELIYSYNLGSRFVDFEGGEPTLWEDIKDNKKYALKDLITLAKKIGFFSTTITTNLKNPLEIDNADLIWVSIDGTKESHNLNRGEESFDKIVENLELIKNNKKLRGRVNVNMVISQLNKKDIKKTVEFVKNHPVLNKIALNFYTSCDKNDELFIKKEEKNELIDLIIKLKKEKYPIMNSFSGLLSSKEKVDNSCCFMTNFITPDGKKYDKCPIKDEKECDDCGLLMMGEMKNVYNLNPQTLLSALSVRLF